jgi:ubiquinone/menaquinone biosynthesis C-methylase UbiE
MDELLLYDQTRNELRRLLMNRLPTDFDLENIITAYAYWTCAVVQSREEDWAATVQEYADIAIRDALSESKTEQIELELLRRELRRVDSPLLDVGAGWGRFRSLYSEYGLQAIYTEPSHLGCRLMRRNGLDHPVRCLGQRLGFPAHIFHSVVIGWVLHHDAPDVPCIDIMNEIARVAVPEGRLISIEPLSENFDMQKWRDLIEDAGFEVEKLEIFFEDSSAGSKSKRYAFLTAVRLLDQ